jgi:predicted acyltransferase
MIIVNSPGSGAIPYAPLQHSHWFGCTPTDMVFPTFLFVVGNALSFSIKKYEVMGNAAVLAKVFKRTFVIFLLGYLMYWFPFIHQLADGTWAMKPISHTRIMGVLQRIALCYLFGALILHYFSRKTAIAISIILLTGYWALLYIFGNSGSELTLTGNAVGKLDTFLFGSRHLNDVDNSFDVEGILNTLPAIVNVIAGYLAGDFIQRKGKTFECISKLMMSGASLIFIALFWDQFFPISKELWTSSFVLYTVGIDLLVISLLIYAVEIKNWKRGIYFFNVFGRNPLFIYLLSELLVVVLYMIRIKPDSNLYHWINQSAFQKITPGALGSLLFAVSIMLFCWLVGWWLDKKKIYIRI